MDDSLLVSVSIIVTVLTALAWLYRERRTILDGFDNLRGGQEKRK